MLTKGHGPLRTAAPTGWFLAVIYVIMVKNIIIRLLFPKKKRRDRADARNQIVEKNPASEAKRFFDSLNTPRQVPAVCSACQKSQICAHQRARAAEDSGPYRMVFGRNLCDYGQKHHNLPTFSVEKAAKPRRSAEPNCRKEPSKRSAAVL